MTTALVPPVMVVMMNLVYSASAYPFGRLSDRVSHRALLVAGVGVLGLADVVLAWSTAWPVVLLGVSLWGLHLGLTQGLLAAMIAHTAPADLRGTAYGVFNLLSGVALLAASVAAGVLWDLAGPAATFTAGAALCLATLVLLRAAPPGTRLAAR